MAKKKEVVKAVKPKIKINKYKCDKCGTEFEVSEMNLPVCINSDCKSTSTQQIG